MKQYRKPAFYLYRIIRLADGKAFSAGGFRESAYFTPLGNFFRTEDTIRRHLFNLVRDCTWVDNKNYHRGGYWKWSEEIEGERDKYAVEKYCVLELEKVTMPAATIMLKGKNKDSLAA